MGGNTKFKNARFRTATYVDSEGNRHTVKDRNGNNIEIPEKQMTAEQKQKLASNRANNRKTALDNARERMLNAKAVQEVRKMARTVWAGNSTSPNAPQSFDLNLYMDNSYKLAELTNQIKPGTISNVVDGRFYSNDEFKEMEKILGVKLL